VTYLVEATYWKKNLCRSYSPFPSAYEYRKYIKIEFSNFIMTTQRATAGIMPNDIFSTNYWRDSAFGIATGYGLDDGEVGVQVPAG
jgi:hypothetical protein